MKEPPTSEPTDQSLLARIHAGSEGAAGAIHERYAQRLLALTLAKSSPDLKVREDAEDIVQSVFGSFFRAAQNGLYTAPEGEELWGLFLVIALNKIRAKGAHHRAAKRDIRRTVNEASPADDGASFDPPSDDESAAVILRMVVDEILDRLPSSHRDVLNLRIEGYEIAEIAVKTAKSKRSVERILQEFRKRIAEELGTPDDTGHAPSS
jgi:RNA polymerase sigma-70 factor, ECF subfamily